jgi:hypothetical protein
VQAGKSAEGEADESAEGETDETAQGEADESAEAKNRPLITRPLVKDELASASSCARPRQESHRGGDGVKGSRLPLDWSPDDDERAFARSLGLDPDAVAECFRDYWRGVAGPRGLKADWVGTWRNWCRREAEQQLSRGGARGSIVAVVRDFIRSSDVPVLRDEADQQQPGVSVSPKLSDDKWRDLLKSFRAKGGLGRQWEGPGLPPTQNATRVPGHLLKEFGYGR